MEAGGSPVFFLEKGAFLTYQNGERSFTEKISAEISESPRISKLIFFYSEI